MLGAFVGDSIGSLLEFATGEQSAEKVQTALSMPGGGLFGVSAGQVTDDSELAMCLIRGLLAGHGKLDLHYHCIYYGHWYQYGPFDIGQTTENGLKHCSTSNPQPHISQAAAKTGPGEGSLSNGSMMKITPMAVWAQHLTDDDLAKAV